MEFLNLKNISERYMELVNPTSPQKVLTIGQMAGLKEGSRVIDFGCGYGQVLALWAQQFGISGIGIDIREHACARARQKMAERGLADRIEIVCENAAEYRFEKHAFDVAACIGATFIWDGYRLTIRKMKEAIRPDGKLVIGEAYGSKERSHQSSRSRSNPFIPNTSSCTWRAKKASISNMSCEPATMTGNGRLDHKALRRKRYTAALRAGYARTRRGCESIPAFPCTASRVS